MGIHSVRNICNNRTYRPNPKYTKNEFLQIHLGIHNTSGNSQVHGYWRWILEVYQQRIFSQTTNDNVEWINVQDSKWSKILPRSISRPFAISRPEFQDEK